MGRSKTAGISTDASGNKSVDKIVNWVRIRKRLGKVTHAEAEQFLAQQVTEIEAARERERIGRKTFGEACVRYLKEKQEAGKTTVETDAYHIALVEPWLGHLELVAIHDDAPKLVAFKKHRLEVDKVS